MFTAAEMGGQMPWKKVMRLYPQGADQVVIEGSAATLRGAFTVPDVEWVLELAATLIKADRRQVLDGSKVGRAAIPQHIKAEVWARDGGARRQCGMDGSGGASLEFDHIIPVALGGALHSSTVWGHPQKSWWRRLVMELWSPTVMPCTRA